MWFPEIKTFSEYRYCLDAYFLMEVHYDKNISAVSARDARFWSLMFLVSIATGSVLVHSSIRLLPSLVRPISLRGQILRSLPYRLDHIFLTDHIFGIIDHSGIYLFFSQLVILAGYLGYRGVLYCRRRVQSKCKD